MEQMNLSDSKGNSLSKIIPRIKLVAFDFDGVFTDNSVYVFQDGTEAVMCSRGDGIGLSALNEHGVRTVIISTETNPVVSARSKMRHYGEADRARELLALSDRCARLALGACAPSCVPTAYTSKRLAADSHRWDALRQARLVASP